jgi:hypothetical protein
MNQCPSVVFRSGVIRGAGGILNVWIVVRIDFEVRRHEMDPFISASN